MARKNTIPLKKRVEYYIDAMQRESNRLTSAPGDHWSRNPRRSAIDTAVALLRETLDRKLSEAEMSVAVAQLSENFKKMSESAQRRAKEAKDNGDTETMNFFVAQLTEFHRQALQVWNLLNPMKG